MKNKPVRKKTLGRLARRLSRLRLECAKSNKLAAKEKIAAATKEREKLQQTGPVPVSSLCLARAGWQIGNRWASECHSDARDFQNRFDSTWYKAPQSIHDLCVELDLGPGNRGDYNFVLYYGVIEHPIWINSFIEGALAWLNDLDGDNQISLNGQPSHFRTISNAVLNGFGFQVLSSDFDEDELIVTWRGTKVKWLP